MFRRLFCSWVLKGAGMVPSMSSILYWVVDEADNFAKKQLDAKDPSGGRKRSGRRI